MRPWPSRKRRQTGNPARLFLRKSGRRLPEFNSPGDTVSPRSRFALHRQHSIVADDPGAGLPKLTPEATAGTTVSPSCSLNERACVPAVSARLREARTSNAVGRRPVSLLRNDTAGSAGAAPQARPPTLALRGGNGVNRWPRRLLSDATAGTPSVRLATFLRNVTAAEEVVGTLMILGIFAISFAMIYAGGIPSLQAAQFGANLQQVEQAFTSLDSKLSKAALGESPNQVVTMKLAGGSLTLQNTSWVNVTMRNSDGGIIDCINVTVGSLEYLQSDRYVAWEGGGIWARYPDGGQVMLSPPEFHYDGTTLTLPTVNISGSSSRSGSGTVQLVVNSTNVPALDYPVSNTTRCNVSGARANPLTGGNITVTVRSEYYQAWANFFNNSNVLSLVSATVNSSAKTAMAALSVQPPDKDNAPFTLPIQIVCQNTTNCTHPMKKFTIDLAGRLVNSCGQIQLDLRTPSSNSGVGGADGLHIRLDRAGGAGFKDVLLSVDWKNGSTNEKFDPVAVSSLDCNAPAPPTVSAKVDLLDYSHPTRTVYSEDISQTWGTTCDLDTTWWQAGWTYPVTPPYPAGTTCYDGKSPISASCIDSRSSNATRGTPPIGYAISHYIKKHFELWGVVNFQCGGGAGDKCPGDSTSISLESDYSLGYACSSAVTYLHISQNRLGVTLR